MGQIKESIMRTLPRVVKITANMVVGVLGCILVTIIIPLTDVKDVLTIVSIKIFHQDVIQERLELVDNLPLESYIIVLAIVFAATIILKILNAVASSSAMLETKSHICSCKVFGITLNPHIFPFVTEIYISVRRLQGKMEIYKNELAINENMDRLDSPEEMANENDNVWENIIDCAQNIQTLNSQMEFDGQKKKQLKVASCITDVVQGTILMLLLLRPDLRIRAILSLSTVAGHLGTDPAAGSVLDAFVLYFLLAWNIASPSFRIRAFTSGHKSSLVSASGLVQTLANIMSLAVHVGMAIMIGYFSVFLVPMVILVPAAVHFIVKSTIDNDFRMKKIGLKLSQSLLSAIFPISSPRPEPEEAENEEKTGNRFEARIKNSASEILFLYILHAAALAVAMVTFTILSAVSEDYLVTLVKVEKASGVSIALIIYCLCPMALVMSLLLTILYHHSCGAWKAVTATKTLNGLEWPPLPRSKVTTKWMTLQEGAKADGVAAD